MRKCTVCIFKFICTGCCLSFQITLYVFPIRPFAMWEILQFFLFLWKFYNKKIVLKPVKRIIFYHIECSICKIMSVRQNHLHSVFVQSDVILPYETDHRQFHIKIQTHTNDKQWSAYCLLRKKNVDSKKLHSKIVNSTTEQL